MDGPGLSELDERGTEGAEKVKVKRGRTSHLLGRGGGRGGGGCTSSSSFVFVPGSVAPVRGGKEKESEGQSLFVCLFCLSFVVCLSTTSGVCFVCVCHPTNVEFEVVLDVSLIYTRSHPLHVRRGK